MHIVLLSPSWPIGFPNGIVTYVHHMRSGLLSLGHSVSVLALSGAGGSSRNSIIQLEPSLITRAKRIACRLLRRKPDPVGRVVQDIVDTVLRLHGKYAVDIVEMEESFGWFREVQARLPIPVVVKLHGPSFLVLSKEEQLESAGKEKIHAERDALQGALYVTAPSLSTLMAARSYCRLSLEWGRVIPNPVIVFDSASLWSRRAADPNLLLFVGRFDKVKGGDFLIRAFGQLLLQRPNLRLIFVGPDIGLSLPNGQRVYFDEFMREVLPPAVHCQVEMKGLLAQEQISRLRCEAFMTLVCSPWENQPNTAIEAMLQGCPIVGINSGGLTEMIQHGLSGLLAQPGDQEDFCRQVLRLLDHPWEAESFGIAARRYALQHYDSTEVASQTVAYYHEVLALYGSRGSTLK